jgi:hypothetical protein
MYVYENFFKFCTYWKDMFYCIKKCFFLQSITVQCEIKKIICVSVPVLEIKLLYMKASFCIIILLVILLYVLHKLSNEGI